MRIYTVHELPGAPLDGAGIVLVKEGFSFPAFIFSWAWLVWHRLWIALCIWIGITVSLSFVMQLAFGAGAAMAGSLALQFLLGTEGNDIRRWTLDRKGYRELGVTGGGNMAEAERNFFARWNRPLEVEKVRPVTAPVWPRPAPALSSGDGEVFGLFPQGPKAGS